jgi:hypothetical protein
MVINWGLKSRNVEYNVGPPNVISWVINHNTSTIVVFIYIHTPSYIIAYHGNIGVMFTNLAIH